MKANPTVAVWAGAMGMFSAVLAGAMFLPHVVGYKVLAPLAVVQSLAIFILYIVIHDAAHRSASKNRRLNDLMMFGCGVVFLFDPYLYRRLHLTHHAHTNEDADPDHFTASRFLVLRWAKSFLIAGSYYVYALRRFKKNATLFLHLCFTPALVAGLWFLFRWMGRTDILVAGWLLPDFVAIGLLGFVLTAWPHHPGTDTTRIGAARNLDVPWVLRVLLGNQHLHLVHHVAPTVPWYRLTEYWRENKERLVAKGAPPVP